MQEKSNGSVSFNTDPEKLNMILSNILKNAITFSDEKQKIEIRPYMSDNNLVVEIQDYGKGISEEHQKAIFDRFTRLDSTINSIHRGQGLGLSVTQALIEVLEGKIDVQSKLEEGSLFKVMIPESSSKTEGLSSDANETFFEEEF